MAKRKDSAYGSVMLTQADFDRYWVLYTTLCYSGGAYDENVLQVYQTNLQNEGLLELDESYYLHENTWGRLKPSPSREKFDEFVKEKYSKLAQLLRGSG